MYGNSGIGLLHLISAPPPSPIRNHGILQGGVIKIEDFYRGRVKKNMKFVGGEALIFTKFFRVECNFSQSSEVRRKGKSSTGGGWGGRGTDFKN